ncbi:amino acid ABC transporter ATP-binding protein [Aminobacter ciceronei]|uniref:Polar amino acid transport system ATP-binding protein n=1 Tax=Aminobacter ciceronei TaxID=150723 RepID=A0ABR6CFK9_9HYPH|nr:amino acid ABC transporter ATP-binding protein [Aminobacter ciceronei]MBA8909937.1 polar amino acid transport system ATP-binding protein [Aminobacter ciceronei]MBA9023709.1 polar amino acid transport system ATP-binding protein [Aminobacter ciceronei]
MKKLVEINNVVKAFGSFQALRGVSLDINEGEVVCIIGPSGSGKSTLLRCINHLETVDGGLIKVADNVIGYRLTGSVLHELPDREIAQQRAQIGMVFQQYNLFPHKTVTENIVEGPIIVRRKDPAESRAKAKELLQQVGLAEKADYYPGQLSGGQQQRVAIARALAMEPRLILFDEPTSALDPELVGEVLQVMRRLAASGMTMIVVTHEISFAREAADRVVFMDGGQIVEEGTADELISNPRNERTREFLSAVRA